jgi:uncharacterized protein
MLKISQLYIYPVKSLGGTAMNEALVTPTGFEHDRRWMLVDENCRFISQREVPQMALLNVDIQTGGLRITHRITDASVIIPFGATGREVIVTIWDDSCLARYASAEADKWFTSVLGISCRLVYMPGETRRHVDPRYAPAGAITSFSDAYPFLIIGQASLDDLNSRLTEALPINRFRPNIVFTGGQPYQEDRMSHFTIGNIHFYGVKLCDRCPIPTIDQNSAVRGKEPLKTLAGYRKKDNKILFGQNLVHNGSGKISVGDSMQIISINHDDRFIINQPAGEFS